MSEKIEEFILNFFRKIKCSIADDGNGFIISDIPKSFLDLINSAGDLKICFDKKVDGYELIQKNSSIVRAIEKFLDSAGKTTLLKIDFEIDPEKEIMKFFNLKNCEIGNIEKKHKNNFFARYSFISNFRYLNDQEQVLNEIYIHDGKVVNGDLSGYKVVEGISSEAEVENIKRYYQIARQELKGLLLDKTEECSSYLSDELDKEIDRIKAHYNTQLSELGGNLNKQLERIGELELDMRVSEGEKKKELKGRIDRLRKGLLKMGDDDAKEKVMREQNFSVNNAKQKYSLNVNNKLLNTTVIYYPVYSFNLWLTADGSKRVVEVFYDPLTKTFSDLHCENCNKLVRDVLLCTSGHIVCSDCLDHCSDCGKVYCEKCLKRTCTVCGRKLCKNCAKVCPSCGQNVCKDHFRMDCVSGEYLCLNCLRACSRCHGVTQEKYFGVSIEGSKICKKCLGEENRNKVLKRIFD